MIRNKTNSIDIQTFYIESIADFIQLQDYYGDKLVNSDTVSFLQQYLRDKCWTIWAEYPYKDKDYLSTYYIFYSKMYRNYSKNCLRLHLINEEYGYVGFIVIRPTVNSTSIGRTVINPKCIIEEEAYLMLGKQTSMISGQEYAVDSFPWMKQETDISVCAHVSIWSILRHFGNCHNDYFDTTMGDIVECIEVDWGREVPSRGLTPVNVSDTFKKYYFSPIIIGKNTVFDQFYYDQMFAYIESSIPMVGFIDRNNPHAVSIVGHGRVDTNLLDNAEFLYDNIIENEDGTKILLHSRMIQDIYVMEDNYFPYRRVSRGVPYMPDTEVDYCLNDFRFSVVPLFDKVHITFTEVYNTFRYMTSLNLV